MAKENNNIFTQVKALNLPIGHYVVIGSGVISAYNIRSHKDIDLFIDRVLEAELVKSGWQEKIIMGNFKVMTKGIVEASTKLFTETTYNPTVQNLISSAEIIEGIPFMNLNELIKFKRSLNREKDLNDIILIEKYLNTLNKESNSDL